MARLLNEAVSVCCQYSSAIWPGNEQRGWLISGFGRGGLPRTTCQTTA